eukprot:CAMPEP_0115443394 /NCGR_PEP_ID=MMETSP0271-20121206/37846_1 /TAXON_ID=71861 /ORGANISM="Scrippsiella trochoidea, Strain CCMP3099" /LENGTH=76 /DNA_ID=CAMNT_0002869269 /DNA_START=967 /DNA_END=1195 /DNA_ORIENTATION=+
MMHGEPTLRQNRASGANNLENDPLVAQVPHPSADKCVGGLADLPVEAMVCAARAHCTPRLPPEQRRFRIAIVVGNN